MQITLNIDSANIGGTVEQVFATLSESDKKDLAKHVMLEVLTTPMAAERKAFERQVMDELIAQYKNDSYQGNRITNYEQARSSYKYRERMEKFVSSSDRMLRLITTTATNHYTEIVTAMVKEDPQTQEVFAQMREQFVADLPKMIQMAMAANFASQMGQISGAMIAATGAQASVGMLADGLKQRLASQGIHI